MTMFTTAIPVWLNTTCENGHHEERQLGLQTQLTEDNYDCSECQGDLAKINISGSSNADMRTLEEVRGE